MKIVIENYNNNTDLFEDIKGLDVFYAIKDNKSFLMFITDENHCVFDADMIEYLYINPTNTKLLREYINGASLEFRLGNGFYLRISEME